MFFSRLLLVLMAVTLLSVTDAGAATINAATCSQIDVQAAINSAVTGDMVSVPSGSCTWAGTVTIKTTQKITLQGAGMGSTIITKSPAGTALQTWQSGSRVTGLQFIDSYILVDGDGWRIDHCKIVNGSVKVYGYRETIHPTGLVDHCDFRNSFVGVCGWAGLKANALWAQPLDLGSGKNVVYVEDNTFTHTVFGHAVDANYGGRYVFRYNTLNDVYIEAHSLQGNNERAVRKWEIYNNRINQVSRGMWVPMQIRGGTGVIFNNVLTGTWTLPGIVLDNVRSTTPLAGREDITNTLGWCTGSSRWDENTGVSGYPCRDQIGRSTDQWLWTDASPYPPQQSDPAYAWNNKLGTADVVFSVRNWSDLQKVHIQEGRDYFNNAVKPGYVPYPYPHPLTYAWGTVTLTAPITTPSTTPNVTTTTTPNTTTTTKTTKTTIFKDGKKIVVTIFNR